MASATRADTGTGISRSSVGRPFYCRSGGDFIAIANRSGWFEATSIPSELIRMIAEYFVVVPYAWKPPPPTQEERDLIHVSSDASEVKLCINTATHEMSWQRAWGAQALSDGSTLPYFAVQLLLTPYDGSDANSGRSLFTSSPVFAVGVSLCPWIESTKHFSHGADSHSHVVFVIVHSGSMCAATDSSERAALVIDGKDESNLPAELKAKIVIGVACDLERNVAVFYVNDQPLMEKQTKSSGPEKPRVYEFSIPSLGLTYPLVASFASDVTFRFLPDWTPPPPPPQSTLSVSQ